MTARTLFRKLWDAHLVRAATRETPAILYIDLHLVHEVTSAQAFAELKDPVRDQLRRNHVDLVLGEGSFLDPHTIRVERANGDEQELAAGKIVIATGTSPARPSRRSPRAGRGCRPGR